MSTPRCASAVPVPAHGNRAVLALAMVGVLLCCSCANPLARRAAPPGPRAGAAQAGYLSAAGGRLVDSAGRPVTLVGVSWFGFETQTCAVHGLSVRNWQDMLVQMSSQGFNVLRLPYSNQLLDDPACVPTG